MINMTPPSHSRLPVEPVDGLLRRFFQAEMPHPWPVMKAPETEPAKPGKRSWFGNGGRLALAASIAFLIAGYLALAGNLSTPKAPTQLDEREIGNKPVRVKTRSGRAAFLWEERIPGAQPTILIKVEEDIKTPGRR